MNFSTVPPNDRHHLRQLVVDIGQQRPQAPRRPFWVASWLESVRSAKTDGRQLPFLAAGRLETLGRPQLGQKRAPSGIAPPHAGQVMIGMC